MTPRIAHLLQALRDTHRSAPHLIAAFVLMLAAAMGGFVASRGIVPHADAASVEDEQQETPSRELSPGSRDLLLNIEVIAGIQAAGLRSEHTDYGAALARAAQMSADAASLAPEVPSELRAFLLAQVEAAMSALHAGNAPKAKAALDAIKSRLNAYRSA